MSRAATVVVRDLHVTGDPGQGAATVRGARFALEEGTLVLITPASSGRTVVLCLAGCLEPTSGSIETGDGHRSRAVRDTSWRLAVVRDPPQLDSLAATLVETAGPASRRAAERLGLGPVLDRTVAELDPLHRTLLGLATTVGDGPDVVALDDPSSVLTEAEVAMVLDALRDLVDIEGRTVLVASDLEKVTPAARQLLDRVVQL